mmetsp:Transcript_53592/g.135352  ORF Transcript_53592/g.135352 Transcript_53592/m.135352 type:complete len:725 (+) Transcript_53592:140-2314(+)
MGNKFAYAYREVADAIFCESGDVADNWLRIGERRWVPDRLAERRLLIGADFSLSSWQIADMSCVMVGEAGATLGVIGSKALQRTDGVTLDFVDGQEVFQITLSHLAPSVRSLFFVATPGTGEILGPSPKAAFQMTTSSSSRASNSMGDSPQPVSVARSTGAAVVYLAEASIEFGGAGGASAPNPEPRLSPISRLRAAVPPKEGTLGLVLLALHAGDDHGEPWHVQTLSRKVWIPEGSSKASMNFTKAFQETIDALPARPGMANDQPQAFLPEFPAAGARPRFATCSTMCATSAEQLAAVGQPAVAVTEVMETSKGLDTHGLSSMLAAANRLAVEKRTEAERERARAATLQKALGMTQESLRRTCDAMSNLQYGLEAWRREALLKAKTGDAMQVAKLLSKLPEVPVVEACTPGDDGSVDTWSTPMSPARKHGGLPSSSLSSPGSPSSSVSLSPASAGLLPGGAGHALIEATAAWQDERLDQGRFVGGSGKVQRQRSRASTAASTAASTTLSEAEENPKLRMPRPRAGNPLGSRPPAATVGDVALPAYDDEDRTPLRNLFFESALGDRHEGTTGNSVDTPRRSPGPTSSPRVGAGASQTPPAMAPSGPSAGAGGSGGGREEAASRFSVTGSQARRDSISSMADPISVPLPRASIISLEGLEQPPEGEGEGHQEDSPPPPPQATQKAGKAPTAMQVPGAIAKDADEGNWVAGAQPHTVLGGARAEAA